MESTVRRKTPCSKCNKAAGIFTCRGCGKDFCYRHVADHRQELNKQMEEVATHHNHLHETIVAQNAKPNCHPLMTQIDTWEQQSLNKVRQAAENARKELLTVLGTHRNKVANDLIPITEELSKAREEDDYVETDLKEWLEKLEKLKEDLIAAQTIDFGQNKDDNDGVLISKIFITKPWTDYFNQTVGDIHVLENGRVVTHGQTQKGGAVCGAGEYSSGQHRIRFKLEKYGSRSTFSCGIVSKITSAESLGNASNMYGMNGAMYNIQKVLGTQNYNGFSYLMTIDGYRSRQDNIVELLIDCDQRRIRLRNEQTQQGQELNVSSSACPFPWHFFIALQYPNDRIRILEKKN